MKSALIASTIVLCALSLVAWKLQPKPPAGRVPLLWTSDDNPLRKGQIDLFNKENPTVQVQLDPGNNALEKVIVQSLAGVGPDVFDCYDGFQLSAYVKSGIALDLTDELKKDGIDVEHDTFKGAHAPAILDGRVYGMPTNIAADAIWFHRDLFRQAGIPFPKGPWHWADLIPIAQRLTKRDAYGHVVQFGIMFEWYGWEHFLRGFGAKVYSPDGSRCILDRAEAIAALQLMQDLIYKYKVAPSPSDEAAMATQGGWGSGTITYFGAKRGAMALGGRWWLATLRSYKGLELGVVESPYQTVHEFRGYGRGMIVNRAGKHVKEALEFVRYLASPAYNNLVNDQADALCPLTQYAQGERFLHNPAHPEEDSNQVWADAAKNAVSDESSPFVDGGIASRLIQIQLDLIKAGQKSAAEGMRDAAKAINEEIANTLAEDPALAERYKQLTGRTGP